MSIASLLHVMTPHSGWDVGVAGMQAGGERLLTIPAPMAYGKRGQQGIPGNATLIFGTRYVYVPAAVINFFLCRGKAP